MAIVERRPYWRGGRIDFSGGLSVHSRQTANSYVTSPANKYKYIANLCLCIAMRYTHVPRVTDLASTIYNTTICSYNQEFLQPRFLQPGVLRTRVLTTRGSYKQGSYNQEFLHPGVLTTRVLHQGASYNQGF